jgi:hypothetical protein
MADALNEAVTYLSLERLHRRCLVRRRTCAWPVIRRAVSGVTTELSTSAATLEIKLGLQAPCAFLKHLLQCLRTELRVTVVQVLRRVADSLFLSMVHELGNKHDIGRNLDWEAASNFHLVF